VLFGPLINTLLNLLLIGPVIEASVALPSELRAMAAGSAATALGGGYSNYIAVSNTAIHRKCGGRDRASCVCAAAVAGLFFAVHPLFAVVGYVPTLVVAAICVYIGADFLYDNLVDALRTNGLGASLASWAVLATCLLQCAPPRRACLLRRGCSRTRHTHDAPPARTQGHARGRRPRRHRVSAVRPPRAQTASRGRREEGTVRWRPHVSMSMPCDPRRSSTRRRSATGEYVGASVTEVAGAGGAALCPAQPCTRCTTIHT
jgi:hypothetical protein